MPYIQEQPRQTKIAADVDVLVVGAGPSGFAAAYTAAKNGADTLLVEQLGDIGGISTSGLMSHWTGTVTSSLYEKILSDSAQLNEGLIHKQRTTVIDPEKLKHST